MNTIKMGSRKLFVTMGVIFIVLFSWIMPVVASAAELSADATTKSVQLLPPNVGNTCAPLATPIFKAYVYDNAVNSFDVTISDPSYVAIAGSVGETQIPFNLMTRFVDSSGVLHMHVDTPTISVHGTVPVTLTLLSVRTDKTVCAATVTAVLVSSGSAASTATASQGTSHPAYVPPAHRVQPAPNAPASNENPTIGSTDNTVVVNSGVQNTLAKVCDTASGATRLWTILLAIYLLIVAATILAQPTAKPTDQSTVLLGAAIIIPLLVLFGVWISSSACRIGMWTPIVALTIAAVGFALGFRHHPQFVKTSAPTQLPKTTMPPSTKPLITPPPKSPAPPAPKSDKEK